MDVESAVDYDVVVVGSGFGGSVSALRLAEKGYRVAVIEAGRRFADDEFARTSWNVRRWIWAPAVGCYGIQRIHTLRNVTVLAGAGVGGGSLVYCNTMYRPLPAFFEDRQWAGITDWRAELTPYYDQASRMLGVTENPTLTPADLVVREVAGEMGVADTFHPTPVAVHFDRPGEVSPDPYFGGAGPDRTGCTECGACMTGCRVGAKNTLVKNYLYLAEQHGVQVLPLTTVTAVRPREHGGFALDLRRTGRVLRPQRRTVTAGQVVLAAGTWGTQNLLHRMRADGVLPALSDQLGVRTRTNSESLVGAVRTTVDPDRDLTFGTSITSSFHPDADTHIEPVRYGKGSNLMAMMNCVATDGAASVPRWLQAARYLLRHPVRSARLLAPHRWSERTIILLVMQSLDNSITTYLRRTWTGRRKYTSRQGHGEPNPAFIPAAYRASELVARHIDGVPGGTLGEIFNIPLTAHFLGGCVIGADDRHGVVDPYHRVFNYPGLHIVDGSAISANLGVNPSLTITAQAERAMAMWPNRGEADPRPAPGEPYRAVPPVPPANPAVPAHAPAALRLIPLTPVAPSDAEPATDPVRAAGAGA